MGTHHSQGLPSTHQNLSDLAGSAGSEPPRTLGGNVGPGLLTPAASPGTLLVSRLRRQPEFDVLACQTGCAPRLLLGLGQALRARVVDVALFGVAIGCSPASPGSGPRDSQTSDATARRPPAVPGSPRSLIVSREKDCSCKISLQS